MFANDYNLSFSFHIDHEIKAELKISRSKRELFVSFNSELIRSVNIIVNLFKKLKESEKCVFGEIMLHILNEIFNIFSFISISIEFIPKKLTKLILISSGPEIIRSLLSRYNKFKFISMTKHYSIKMFNLLFLGDLKPINEHFRFWFRINEKLFSFLNNGTMSFVNTKCIYFDIILFYFVCTDISFTLF